MLDLRVGRVKAIFRLPETFGKHASADPLAYIEWFSTLDKVNTVLGMYEVSPWIRTHRGQPYRASSIIPLPNIIRSCHLIPQWGEQMDRSWTSESVLDQAQRFYVNTYCRHSDFVLYRFLDSALRR